MKCIFILFLYILSNICVNSFAQTSDNDSLRWIKANQKMEAANFHQACSLYMDLDKRMDTIYAKINSQKIEDLRKVYSVDEVQLQSNIVQNKILQLIVWIGIVFIILFIIFFFYIKQQNKRLIRSQEELNKAKGWAEESIRNKSLFLSNMSHEIKTPLNALSGFSEVLTTPGIDETTRQQCNDIIQLNSELLLKLLNDVIDISCLDTTNMKFNIKHCEVVELCQNVVITLNTIKQTNASISFESEFSSLELETDADRLQQMLINILVNATKFTKQGSIILKLEKADDKTVRFSVTDTGCGIPLENQRHIFERFEKLNEKDQGTGLGLSICLLIIKRLGGNIWIDPQYRDGARFIFVHPLKQETQA